MSRWRVRRSTATCLSTLVGYVRPVTDTTATDEAISTPTKPLRFADGTELDSAVEEYDRVLAEFYTKGCTLCQAIEPVLGNVARATDVAVVMLNPRDDLDLVEEYNVRSVPTLVLFEDGDVVGRLAEGFQGTERVVEFVESHLDGGASNGVESREGTESDEGEPQ